MTTGMQSNLRETTVDDGELDPKALAAIRDLLDTQPTQADDPTSATACAASGPCRSPKGWFSGTD